MVMTSFRRALLGPAPRAETGLLVANTVFAENEKAATSSLPGPALAGGVSGHAVMAEDTG
jgi:hypothetical protein